MSDNVNKILAVIRSVPRGRVATYGQVARLAGIPRNARQVGAVLGNLSDDVDVPWFRVVNASGRISSRDDPTFEGLQRHELENEGVEFDHHDRVDLAKYQWKCPE